MVHNNHFLMVTLPAQGHINPALQFSKSLIRTGAQVTFTTTVSAHKRMLATTTTTTTLEGLTFAPFSLSNEYNNSKTTSDHLSEIKSYGSEKLTDLIVTFANERRPITCLIYTTLLPWAADVASNFNIPSALLWIQPATVFDIYYYYFDGHSKVFANDNNDPSYSVKLPGLPLLASRDLPSFLQSSKLNDSASTIKLFQEQFEVFKRETNPRILVNTFDALEEEALRVRAVDGIKLIGIGPLVPSAFIDGKDSSDTSFGGDIFESTSNNYIEWLNTKEKASVVYVSFGSITVLDKRQMEEIARALIECGWSFLWVIRQQHTGSKEEEEEEEEEEYKMLSRRIKEEGNEKGMIVPWCSQMEVLAHRSVGCFVSHCGWNSTLESLVGGVPVVCFPQWSDQGTNAKLIEDVWRTGVRVKEEEEKTIVVESEEIKRCLEMVMGGEMRNNAKKWKDLAREAVEEDGSSEKNLRAFVEEVGRRCW